METFEGVTANLQQIWRAIEDTREKMKGLDMVDKETAKQITELQERVKALEAKK